MIENFKKLLEAEEEYIKFRRSEIKKIKERQKSASIAVSSVLLFIWILMLIKAFIL